MGEAGRILSILKEDPRSISADRFPAMVQCNGKRKSATPTVESALRSPEETSGIPDVKTDRQIIKLSLNSLHTFAIHSR